MRVRAVSGLSILTAIVLVAALVRLTVGRVPLETGEWQIVFSLPSQEVLPLRLGATISALAAGWALGLAGCLLQVLLRNPLASPWILGLSSGAGLGVMIALAIAVLTGVTIPGGGGLMLPAVLGARRARTVAPAAGGRGGRVTGRRLVDGTAGSRPSWPACGLPRLDDGADP
jgi:iron complex transport system permease protein